MTLLDIFATVMIYKLAKKMWANLKMRSYDLETFRLKYAEQELVNYQKQLSPKPRLTHFQMFTKIVIVYFVLCQFSWIPKK